MADDRYKGFPTAEWIDKYERMPVESDCDPWGCVLIYDQLNGVMVTGFRNRQQLNRQGVTHWARIPVGPEGAAIYEA